MTPPLLALGPLIAQRAGELGKEQVFRKELAVPGKTPCPPAARRVETKIHTRTLLSARLVDTERETDALSCPPGRK